MTEIPVCPECGHLMPDGVCAGFLGHSNPRVLSAPSRYGKSAGTDHPDSVERHLHRLWEYLRTIPGTQPVDWVREIQMLHALELAAERERYAKLEAENELMRAVITLCLSDSMEEPRA